MRLFFACISLLIFSYTLATPSHAYFKTAQQEVRLQDGTGLFLIEYAFGMEKREVTLPIFAQTAPNVSNTLVSYEILDNEGETAQGTSFGIVLSDTSITEDGMYKVEKGTSKRLTLAVFFTPETKNTGTKYRLHVTHLPFQFDGTQELQLNPSELKHYQTELLSL
jgi:asparagine N-glycosylation enzyme membrane subunit Stt3